MFPNCGDVYSYFRFVISGFLVQVQAGKFFNRNLNTIIYNNGGIIMKSLEEKAKDFARKVYTNGQERLEDSSSIIALGESCYIKGAEEQRKIDIKKMCDYMCDRCPAKLSIFDMRGVVEECTPQEKENCNTLKSLRAYMEE